MAPGVVCNTLAGELIGNSSQIFFIHDPSSVFHFHTDVHKICSPCGSGGSVLMAGTNLRRRERKLDIPPWIAEKYRSVNAPYPLVGRHLAIEGNLDIRDWIAEN
jgi:hypothetical protein